MATERPTVAVLDYGSGNVHSAVKALAAAGADVTLTRDRDIVSNADGLLVPGVGAFAAVMAALRDVRGDELIERRLAGGRPVLGICVGMQVMFERGVAHGLDTEGLGEWPGVVDELVAPILPHMGWNTVEARWAMSLMMSAADCTAGPGVISCSITAWKAGVAASRRTRLAAANMASRSFWVASELGTMRGGCCGSVLRSVRWPRLSGRHGWALSAKPGKASGAVSSRLPGTARR